MTLFTRSVWYYGHTVTLENRALDFNEGSGEIAARLRVGTYGLTEFAAEVSRALNLFGENTYTVTLNRQTRRITISSDSNFSLLAATGTSSGASVYSLLGFTTDQTGSNSYTGDPSGSEYSPTVRLQDYIDFDFNQESVDAIVNTTASGRVESVTFGSNKFMTCNIRYQSNRRLSFAANRENAVEDMIDFLRYATTKATMEFMPDIDDRGTFKTVVLERTEQSSTGTGFRVTESNGIPGIYDSGRLVFRERVV